MKLRADIARLIVALVMVSLVVACSKVSRIPGGDEQEIAVKPLSATMSKVVTGPVVGAFPKEETMGIFAFYSAAESGSQWAVDVVEEAYFPKTEFIFKDYAQAWGAETPVYWPDQGSLVFAGFSPYKRPKTVDGSQVLEEIDMTYDFANKALKVENYLVCQYIPMTQEQIQRDDPYVNVAQSDLMFFLPQLDEDGRYVGVNHLASNNVQFHHALSLVEFTVVAEDDAAINRVDLSKITVKSVFHRGDFTATALPDGEVNVDWGTSLSNAYDVDVFHAENPEFGLELFLQPRTIAQLMIIPGVTHDIEIIYHVMVNGTYYEQKAVYTPEDLNLLEWEAGKKYVYNIVLGVDRMTFSPVTSVWEE